MIRILTDRDDRQACLYCSTYDWAFGPVFHNTETEGTEAQARRFLRFLTQQYMPREEDLHEFWRRPFGGWDHDPRKLTDAGLQQAFWQWVDEEKGDAVYGRGPGANQLDDREEKQS